MKIIREERDGHYTVSIEIQRIEVLYKSFRTAKEREAFIHRWGVRLIHAVKYELNMDEVKS